ncbi:hypothetical protein [Fusobacterium varium]|uniref:hypothetical protein n=1 Tax=Fusobacterium varium TaxID=856 RepID=UPI00242D392C|nr:hypothetical protein [Fusobacterium varium]
MSKVIKMKMSIPEWNYICDVCKRLGIDPHQYEEVENYGRLIFHLTKLDIVGHHGAIPPDPADYNKGGKYGN